MGCELRMAKRLKGEIGSEFSKGAWKGGSQRREKIEGAKRNVWRMGSSDEESDRGDSESLEGQIRAADEEA